MTREGLDMSSFARFVLRHRRLVLIFWLIAFVAGGAAAGKTSERLTLDFSLPGQDGYETAKEVLKTYGTEGQDAPLMLVLVAPPGGVVADGDAARAFAAVQAAVPEARIVDKAAAGGDPVFATADGRAQFAYAFGPPQTSFDSAILAPLESALEANAPAGTDTQITGLNMLAEGNSGENSEPASVLIETLVGGVGALAVLLFVFASFLALLPLAIAAVSILSTFLILLGLTYISDVSFIVQFLVSLVGLGVAIDYSLLIVTRWREERDHGRSNTDAVVVAMETAGHAVVFSGLTVAISLFALVFLPVPFLRSIGYGGMLIPLVSVAVTTTLLPVILGSIGPRVDWPKIRHENRASRFWSAWGRLIVRHRWVAATVATAMLVALIAPVFSMKIGNPQSESLASAGPAHEAFQLLREGGVPAGILTPIEVLSSEQSASAVADGIRGVDGLVTAFVERGNAGTRDGMSLSMAIPIEETANDKTVQVVRDVKDEVSEIPGAVGVVGIGAMQLDYLKGVYGNFPLVLTIILIVTYVLLARAFRSLLLPLKAVLLNIASLAATFGALVLFWQLGYGSEAIYDIEATGAITFWLPIMIFAFLFGLSMDYEVFILARMREEWDSTGRTNGAVVTGLARTGRLVTSAAVILFLSFMSLSSVPATDVKLLATGLGIGILLDATVIRMLLVPALVSLFGKWNWYMPDGVAKLLRVEPSSRVPESVPETGHDDERKPDAIGVPVP